MVRKFGDNIDIESLKDEGKTGNFNISVEGRIIHDKHKDGEYNTHAKKVKVFEAIIAELRKDGSNEPLIATITLDVDEEEDKAGNRSVYFSLFTLLISIPALIGA